MAIQPYIWTRHDTKECGIIHACNERMAQATLRYFIPHKVLVKLVRASYEDVAELGKNLEQEKTQNIANLEQAKFSSTLPQQLTLFETSTDNSTEYIICPRCRKVAVKAKSPTALDDITTHIANEHPHTFWHDANCDMPRITLKDYHRSYEFNDKKGVTIYAPLPFMLIEGIGQRKQITFPTRASNDFVNKRRKVSFDIANPDVIGTLPTVRYEDREEI